MDNNTNMNNKIIITPNDQQPADDYDDGNIPQVDLPQEVIPDEVPRKDGPGGDGKM
ncbi:MAG: hypothetical protein II992_10995 [Lachnospiraceae bacterium]|nr:hypothetical protein [Lachnospiraceae bacterium]MBQ3601710.1 hypothetical protein [Lachnospiraceae bacterium]MBQ6993168.1 hypothetical protein [Lachnospiraceae bacterium]